MWSVLRNADAPWVKDPRGSPHPPRMVIFALVLKIAFFTTYDGIEARLKAMRELVKRITGRERIPTHSVIHEGMLRVRMKYLRKVFRRTISKVCGKRRGALDSTGLSTRNSSVWYDIRIGRENKRRDCVKLHVLVDVDSGEILAARITLSSAHDGPRGRAMLREVWDLEIVTGDGAYASRENCNVAASRGAKPYFLPRKDARARSKGSPEYKVMVRAWRDDETAWLGVYHIRSFVEAVFASIKKRFGKILLSLKKSVRRRELFLKVLCHNLKEGLYNARAHELGIDRWKVPDEE